VAVADGTERDDTERPELQRQKTAIRRFAAGMLDRRHRAVLAIGGRPSALDPEARHELRGQRTGIRYQLTDRVTVQVSRVDLDARRIDLRLVHQPDIHTQIKKESRRADAEHVRGGLFGAKKAAKKAPKKAAAAKPESAKARKSAKKTNGSGSASRAGRKKRK
jgi:hypothetical protein